jgi:hypothetical protein
LPFEDYRKQEIEENDAGRARIDEIVMEDSLIDAKEPSEFDNVIYCALITHVKKLSALDRLSHASLQRLHKPVPEVLAHRRCDRTHRIGPSIPFSFSCTG